MRLILGLMLVFESLSARAGTWLEVPRDEDGKIISLHKEEAIEYCAGRGARLPTLREFSEYAQTQGALGILETKYPNAYAEDENLKKEIVENKKKKIDPSSPNRKGRMEYNKYESVWKWSESGALIIDFYYSKDGYKGGFYLGQGFAITEGSSKYWAQQPNSKLSYHQVFDIETGYIVDTQRIEWAFVRCIVD